MSVLQSAAHGDICPPALSRREHEKTIHCPLYTIHWHGSAGHQLAGRSYTYTAQRYMFSVHEDEKLNVYYDEIVYEYENVNENDYAITEAKPEQALRDPRHHHPRRFTGTLTLQTAVCGLSRRS